jgi:hypothetical protein
MKPLPLPARVFFARKSHHGDTAVASKTQAHPVKLKPAIFKE